MSCMSHDPRNGWENQMSIYYNFRVMESIDEKSSEHLLMDTVTRHIHNANSLHFNDLYNGRFSIPIVRSSPRPYLSRGMKRYLQIRKTTNNKRGCLFLAIFLHWKKRQFLFYPKCTEVCFFSYGVVDGKHQQSISHSVGSIPY